MQGERVKCGHCGKRDDLQDLISNHRCRAWRKAMYTRMYTWPQLMTFFVATVAVTKYVMPRYGTWAFVVVLLGAYIALDLLQVKVIDRWVER